MNGLFDNNVSLNPTLKTTDEVEQLSNEAIKHGYYIIPEQTLIRSPIGNLGQRLIQSSLDSDGNECIVMKLPVPLHYIGLMIKHDLNDLINMLRHVDKYGIINIKYIHMMIIDNIEEELCSNNTNNTNICFANKNKGIINNRLFGAGDRYSKVTDEVVREQLQLLTQYLYVNTYVDQIQSKTYEFPLVFYSKQVFEQSCLDNTSNIFNLEFIRYIIDDLELSNQHTLCVKIMHIFFRNPNTSGLVRFQEFRRYVSDEDKAFAFHIELIREQMCGVGAWKYNLTPWTLDNIKDIPFSIEKSWYLDQLYIRRFRFECKDTIYTHKIPDNNEATERFHRFSHGLLHFPDELISAFYSDNLVIGGSSFAYSACAVQYHDFGDESDDELDNTAVNTLDQYIDSDIDCVIMAGDNIFMTQDELEHIVNQKLEFLRNYYPTNWVFTKSTKEKRFLISNNQTSRVMEFYSAPYSKNTIWKHFSKYHFGWVRGYFDGITWYILPSGVISVLTRLSIDIRYCATKHAPQALILKYLERDFYPILNYSEINQLNLYLRNINKEKHILKYPDSYSRSMTIYY
jgi:hypothetical protein